MKPDVHILATCRNPELFPATTLVFQTLRTGFPTTRILIRGNALNPEHSNEIAGLAASIDAEFRNGEATVHHEWISYLIENEDRPFFICDTDQMFLGSFEQWDFSGCALAGRLIPRFFDEVTNCITFARLHTSLLYIDPKLVRAKSRRALNKLCTQSPFHLEPNLVHPATHYQHGQSYFHDTMSQLYHAIGGKAFTPAQLDRFAHLNCGTYIDLVEGRFTLARNLRQSHRNIIKNPELANGLWRLQEDYYSQFRV